MNEVDCSIIIPMYNCEKYIGHCLDSLIGMNIPLSQYEVIVVNDGSTDNSASVVQKYVAEYPNIRYIEQKNQGISAARNAGFHVCKGQYVYFVDADDFVFSASLEFAIRTIKEMELEVLEIGRVSGSEAELAIIIPRIGRSDLTVVKGYDLVKEGVMFFVTSFIFKKSFLVQNNLLFQSVYAYEDVCFVVTALLQSESAASLRTLQVYAYVLRSESVSHNGGKIKYREFADAIINVRSYTDNLINESPFLPDSVAKIIKDKTNTYTFYLANRIIRFCPYDYFKYIYNRLRSLNYLPIARMDGLHGFKWNIIRFVVNHKWLFFIARFFIRPFYR